MHSPVRYRPVFHFLCTQKSKHWNKQMPQMQQPLQHIVHCYRFLMNFLNQILPARCGERSASNTVGSCVPGKTNRFALAYRQVPTTQNQHSIQHVRNDVLDARRRTQDAGCNLKDATPAWSSGCWLNPTQRHVLKRTRDTVTVHHTAQLCQQSCDRHRMNLSFIVQGHAIQMGVVERCCNELEVFQRGEMSAPAAMLTSVQQAPPWPPVHDAAC